MRGRVAGGILKAYWAYELISIGTTETISVRPAKEALQERRVRKTREASAFGAPNHIIVLRAIEFQEGVLIS